MKIETENLKTVKNIARKYDYSQVYVYRLIKKGILKAIIIDEMMFLDVESLPQDFGKKNDIFFMFLFNVNYI
jgi:hypothetical protein